MDDVDSDNEYEDEQMAGQEEIHRSDLENQQRLMRRLPEEDKKKIQQQIEIFKVQQEFTYLESCPSSAHSNQIRERSGQVGRDWKWLDRPRQTHVHDHDEHDGLYSVRNHYLLKKIKQHI